VARIVLPSGTEAVLARPAGKPQVGLVLLPDILGLRPLFDDLCARLAREWQMVVCAPDPLPGVESTADLSTRLAATREVPDARRLGDVLAAADACGTDRAVLIGFCQGGTYAYKASGLGRFERAVAFYGPVRPALGSSQRAPLDLVDGARVLALVGGRDRLLPPADADDLEKAGAIVVRYPDADHGFVHDPTRPAHRPDDAADAWQRCRAWLS
jgi:carboxymethylenebutenolidase